MKPLRPGSSQPLSPNEWPFMSAYSYVATIDLKKILDVPYLHTKRRTQCCGSKHKTFHVSRGSHTTPLPPTAKATSIVGDKWRTQATTHYISFLLTLCSLGNPVLSLLRLDSFWLVGVNISLQPLLPPLKQTKNNKMRNAHKSSLSFPPPRSPQYLSGTTLKSRHPHQVQQQPLLRHLSRAHYNNIRH